MFQNIEKEWRFTRLKRNFLRHLAWNTLPQGLQGCYETTLENQYIKSVWCRQTEVKSAPKVTPHTLVPKWLSFHTNLSKFSTFNFLFSFQARPTTTSLNGIKLDVSLREDLIDHWINQSFKMFDNLLDWNRVVFHMTEVERMVLRLLNTPPTY